jgi:ABC-type lipoprotein release transport system permease subunit
MSGAVIGIILGGLLAFLQQTSGLIEIQTSGQFLVSAYPARIIFSDFLLVFTTVFIISLAASWLTAKHSIRPLRNISGLISE